MKDGVLDVGVSKNRGTPKSSILIGFSLINHPFWGTIIFGNTHVYIYIEMGHGDYPLKSIESLSGSGSRRKAVEGWWVFRDQLLRNSPSNGRQVLCGKLICEDFLS